MRHVLGTSFHRWRDSVATEMPWLSQEEKCACLFFICQQVHLSCQVTMGSEDRSCLTPTSTTPNNLQTTSAPPMWRSLSRANPPQGRATPPSWIPTSRSPTGTTAHRRWCPARALCWAPPPCRHSCRPHSPATPHTLCWWVCIYSMVRESLRWGLRWSHQSKGLATRMKPGLAGPGHPWDCSASALETPGQPWYSLEEPASHRDPCHPQQREGWCRGLGGDD